MVNLIDYKPSEKQDRFHKLPDAWKGLHGPRNSGKTHALLVEVARNILKGVAFEVAVVCKHISVLDIFSDNLSCAINSIGGVLGFTVHRTAWNKLCVRGGSRDAFIVFLGPDINLNCIEILWFNLIACDGVLLDRKMINLMRTMKQIFLIASDQKLDIPGMVWVNTGNEHSFSAIRPGMGPWAISDMWRKK